MIPLRQSTTATVIVGQFVDDTDFKTAETALTIAPADVRLSKNGAADVAKNEASNATHEGDGFYSVPLDATDTNTVGRLTMWIAEAGALGVGPVRFTVIEESIYDALFAASAAGFDSNQRVDVGEIGGTAVAAAAAGYFPADLLRVDGAALGTHVAGELPADIRSQNLANLSANVAQVDGVALDTHDAGKFPSDLRMVDGVALVSHNAGEVPADITSFSPGATVDANVVQVGGNAARVTNWGDYLDFISAGAVVSDGGNTTTQFKTNLTDTTNDIHSPALIIFLDGQNAKARRWITAFNGTTKFVTVEPLPNTPDPADKFIII